MRLIVTKPPPFPFITVDEAYIENAPNNFLPIWVAMGLTNGIYMAIMLPTGIFGGDCYDSKNKGF